MYSTLATHVLAERAQGAVSDPAFSPYSDTTSDVLRRVIAELRQMQPTPLTLRPLALAVLVDFDNAQQERDERAQQAKMFTELSARVDELSAAGQGA